MVSRLCFFVILSICLSTSFTDETCEGLPKCICSNDQIACESIEEPLDLKPLNLAITKVVLSSSTVNGALFSSDSDVQHLTELSLIDCNINNTDFKAFSNMRSLKSLSLVSSSINFRNLNLNGTALEILNLTQCGLTYSDLPHMRDVLRSVPTLKTLVLSKNAFKNFSASILNNLNDLKVLHARECELDSVPSEDFHFSAKLVEVDLSNNRLSRLPKFLLDSSKDSLEKLSLSGNPMSEIDLNFADFKSLNYLKVDEMNLNCSCLWVDGLSSKTIQPSDVLCHDENHANFNLADFSSRCAARKSEPGEEESNKSLVIVIIILVVVAVIAAVGCLVHRFLSNRRRRAQEKKTVRYSAVYRETVESSAPAPKVALG